MQMLCIGAANAVCNILVELVGDTTADIIGFEAGDFHIKSLARGAARASEQGDLFFKLKWFAILTPAHCCYLQRP
jgi:hypothetical protein